jgi:methylase of polypeptide subunit release factors
VWEVFAQAVVRQHAQGHPREIAGGIDMSVVEVRRTSFGGLTIAHDHRVLTPRRWTLQQSRWALELLQELPDGPVLELCCGAGQIGLVVAAGTTRQLVCVDADPVAARYTLDNAVAAGLQDRVEMRLRPLRDALENGETFPLILADPPWVTREEVGRFPDDPVTAIDGGPAGGLDVARECLHVIGKHLTSEGRALLQLGSSRQVEALAAEIDDAGLRVTATRAFGDRGVLVLLAHQATSGHPREVRAGVGS